MAMPREEGAKAMPALRAKTYKIEQAMPLCPGDAAF